MKRLLFLFIILGLCFSFTTQTQHKERIYFNYDLRNGISVSGYWEQPSAWNVDDGECHINASGGTGNLICKLYYPDGSTQFETLGNFYNLAPGFYFFEVYDFGSGAMDMYPEAELYYPTGPGALYSTSANSNVNTSSESFGSNTPGRN